MAQSPEYPDLKWMPPRSWTDANRSAVQLVVVHTTEGAARARAAEDGAAYDQRRRDGTSTHYFHDSDSTVQCVRTADQAHTARTQGNRRGIHHELCTRAGHADWGDTYHQAMLRRAARQAARDAKRWDIPVRKLTPAQVAAGEKGFCGHVEITKAFPQDRGTHTDPGSNFPWSQFLTMVRDEMEDDVPLSPTEKKEIIEGVTKAVTDALLARLPAAVWAHDIDPDPKKDHTAGGGAWTDLVRAGSVANDQLPKLAAAVEALPARVAAELTKTPPAA